jgi:hypothetical protein
MILCFGVRIRCSANNQFLRERNSYGYAVLDKIPVKNPYRYLKEKFQIGLTFPAKQAKEPMRLGRILGFGHAVDGSSHMCSVADMMLGAFRYCVNEPENKEVGKARFPTLMGMMWKHKRNGNTYVNDYGLALRPAQITIRKHQDEYEALVQRLQSYLS